MRQIRSRDELVEWAEDEGALDDSIVIAVDPAACSVTIGLGVHEDAGDDPRDAFRRTTVRYMPFTLSSEDGSVSVDGDLAPNADFEAALLEDGDAFGIAFETGEATVNACARAWRVEVGEPIEVPVVPEFSPATLTFHGAGPLTAALLREAFRASGGNVELFGNWNGSGQSMGAAFVRDVKTPPPVPDDEALSGAWRVVPAGAPATDPRGLWISGNAARQSAYAIVERTSESDPSLVRATVEALASLPGLSWASSGNRLVEDAAARAAWLAAE